MSILLWEEKTSPTTPAGDDGLVYNEMADTSPQEEQKGQAWSAKAIVKSLMSQKDESWGIEGEELSKADPVVMKHRVTGEVGITHDRGKTVWDRNGKKTEGHFWKKHPEGKKALSEVEISAIHSGGEKTSGKGPFVGPRGGKWADAKHTVPWKEPTAAKKEGPEATKKAAMDKIDVKIDALIAESEKQGTSQERLFEINREAVKLSAEANSIYISKTEKSMTGLSVLEDHLAKALPSATAKVSPEKARQILHDGEVNGKPLTDQQRKFFGAIGGHLPAPKGKKVEKSMSAIDNLGELLEKAKYVKRTGSPGSYKYEYDTPAGGRVSVPSKGAEAGRKARAKESKGAMTEERRTLTNEAVDLSNKKTLSPGEKKRYGQIQSRLKELSADLDDSGLAEMKTQADKDRKGADRHEGMMRRMKAGESVIANSEKVAKFHGTIPAVIDNIWHRLQNEKILEAKNVDGVAHMVRTSKGVEKSMGGVDGLGDYLEKAKYTKRTGTPGNYRYEYANRGEQKREKQRQSVKEGVKQGKAHRSAMELRDAEEGDSQEAKDYRSYLTMVLHGNKPDAKTKGAQRAQSALQAGRAKESKSDRVTKVKAASRSNVPGIGIAETADGRLVAYRSSDYDNRGTIKGEVVNMTGVGGEHAFGIATTTYKQAALTELGITDAQIVAVNNALLSAKEKKPDPFSSKKEKVEKSMTSAMDNLTEFVETDHEPLSKSLLSKGMLGGYGMEWANRFMGTPFEVDALQCLKKLNMISAERAEVRKKYDKNWRERQDLSAVARAKHSEKMSKMYAKCDAKEDAERKKQGELEEKYLDWRIEQAKETKKSDPGMAAGDEVLEKSEIPTGQATTVPTGDASGRKEDGGPLIGLGKPSGSGHAPNPDADQDANGNPKDVPTSKTQDWSLESEARQVIGGGVMKSEGSLDHDRALAAARLRKGEGEIHPFSVTAIHGDSDKRAVSLVKGGANEADPRNAIVSRDMLCKSCGESHAAMLTACPGCGYGAIGQEVLAKSNPGVILEDPRGAPILRRPKPTEYISF